MPTTEFAAFEAPTKDIVEDYKGVIEENGINFRRMSKIAMTFDKLRQTRRHSVMMIDHNNDMQQKRFFKKKFEQMVS